MERVSFILEGSERRISALLNPESLEVRRWSGVRRRQLDGQDLSRPMAADDEVVLTSGGRTELTMQLLFDVGVSGSSGPPVSDVRQLTGPFRALAENIQRQGDRMVAPRVRFVWGKAWNVPGFVLEVAERFERFQPAGQPTRSWLTLRLRRALDEHELAPAHAASAAALDPALEFSGTPEDDAAPVHLVRGTEDGAAERLDLIAARHYGNPAYWRHIAEANDLEDPQETSPGDTLILPAAESLDRAPPSEDAP